MNKYTNISVKFFYETLTRVHDTSVVTNGNIIAISNKKPIVYYKIAPHHYINIMLL